MLKKIMLMISLGFFLATNTTHSYDITETFMEIVNVVVQTNMLISWINRESNQVQIKRIHAMHTKYDQTIRALLLEMESIIDPGTFEAEALFKFDTKIYALDHMISNSYQAMKDLYESWGTPWNHTVKMQRAYQTICDLHQQWKNDLFSIQAKKEKLLQRLQEQQLIIYGKLRADAYEKRELKAINRLCTVGHVIIAIAATAVIIYGVKLGCDAGSAIKSYLFPSEEEIQAKIAQSLSTAGRIAILEAKKSFTQCLDKHLVEPGFPEACEESARAYGKLNAACAKEVSEIIAFWNKLKK